MRSRNANQLRDTGPVPTSTPMMNIERKRQIPSVLEHPYDKPLSLFLFLSLSLSLSLSVTRVIGKNAHDLCNVRLAAHI